jgi:hypothetical protein
MYQFGSHRNQKIVLYTKDIRLRASSEHGGQGVFLNVYPRSAAGAPRWGRGYLSLMMERGVIISVSYLNTTSFIGNYGSGEFLLL